MSKFRERFNSSLENLIKLADAKLQFKALLRGLKRSKNKDNKEAHDKLRSYLNDHPEWVDEFKAELEGIGHTCVDKTKLNFSKVSADFDKNRGPKKPSTEGYGFSSILDSLSKLRAEDTYKDTTDLQGNAPLPPGYAGPPARSPGDLETKYPKYEDYSKALANKILSDGQNTETIKALSYLPEVKRGLALSLIEMGKMKTDAFRELVSEGHKVRVEQSKHQRQVDEQLNPPPPKPEAPSMTGPALATVGVIGGAKLLDLAISKGMDIWSKHKKHSDDEESFDRIIATHPKFKSVSSEDMPRLKALHSMITDYSPTLKDHEMVLGDVLHNASQYQDFDPSLLKTLTEPEKNRAAAKKEQHSIFNDPTVEGVGKFRSSVESMAKEQQ